MAAKGMCDPRPFIEALSTDNITTASNVDIHIAHDGNWPIDPKSMPSNVYLHPCPPSTSILKLWGVALAKSTGHFTAVLDIHCPPSVGWLQCALTEIGKDSALFFGPVDPGWKKHDQRIVGYLAEYAQFSSPLAIELNEVPGNNLVCQRSLLGDFEKLQTDGFFKTFMIWRLANEKHLLPTRLNGMIVKYQKPFRCKHYIARRFIHGRCFGATRHDNDGQPPRLACIGFTFFLPLVRTWRIYKAVQKHHDLKKSYFRFLILILWSECAWSAGELVGYVCGGRAYCNRLD